MAALAEATSGGGESWRGGGGRTQRRGPRRGQLRASQPAILGEDGEGSEAVPRVAFDLNGRAYSGGTARRRRRQLRPRGREKGRERIMRRFYGKVLAFYRNREKVPPRVETWTAGSFSDFCRGVSEKASSTPRAGRRIAGGRPGSQHCSTVANTVDSYSTTVRAERSQASISGVFNIVSSNVEGGWGSSPS